MVKPKFQVVLTFICLVFSAAIAQELRGNTRDNEESPFRQADAVTLQQSHFTIQHDNYENEQQQHQARALTRKKLRGGFDLKKVSRPRNTRDPDKLKKQYGLAQKKAQSTRKKPYNSSALAAAAKGIREKKASIASTAKKGKKKSGGRIKSSFQNFESRVKGAGKRIKKALGKRGKRKGGRKKKRGNKKKKPATKKKTGKVDTAPGSTQTESTAEDDGEDRIEPQNPLKVGGISTSQSSPVEQETPLEKPLPQAPLVKPKPQAPLEKPTTIDQSNESQTIPALQQGGVDVQPPMEAGEEDEEEEPLNDGDLVAEEEPVESEPLPKSEPVPVPVSEPAPDTPAPIMLAVGGANEEEVSPVAAPAYGPSAPFAPFSPSSPVAAE